MKEEKIETDFEKDILPKGKEDAVRDMILAVEKLTGVRLIRSDLLVPVTVIVAGQKYSGLLLTFPRKEKTMKNRRESDLNFLDMVAHLVDQAVDGNSCVISIRTSSRTNLHKGGPLVHMTAEGFYRYFGDGLYEYLGNSAGQSIVRTVRGDVEYYALIGVKGCGIAPVPASGPLEEDHV